VYAFPFERRTHFFCYFHFKSALSSFLSSLHFPFFLPPLDGGCFPRGHGRGRLRQHARRRRVPASVARRLGTRPSERGRACREEASICRSHCGPRGVVTDMHRTLPCRCSPLVATFRSNSFRTSIQDGKCTSQSSLFSCFILNHQARVRSLQDGGDGGGDGNNDDSSSPSGGGGGAEGGGGSGGGLRNDAGEMTIPQDVLQKYIQYARTHMRPSLHGQDQ